MGFSCCDQKIKKCSHVGAMKMGFIQGLVIRLGPAVPKCRTLRFDTCWLKLSYVIHILPVVFPLPPPINRAPAKGKTPQPELPEGDPKALAGRTQSPLPMFGAPWVPSQEFLGVWGPTEPRPASGACELAGGVQDPSGHPARRKRGECWPVPILGSLDGLV